MMIGGLLLKENGLGTRGPKTFDDLRYRPGPDRIHTERVAFISDIGLGRQRNEDAAWMAPDTFPWDRAGRLMAVADGMGGHAGGGLASQFACKALADYYRKLPRRCSLSKPVELCRHLSDLIFRIDRRLRTKASAISAFRDMGTTLSCLVLTATHSIIGHVGDSRIYRWRGGHLSCLTRDHSFVQEMITEGEVDPEDAGNHPLKHLLTQAVGTCEPLEHVMSRVDAVKAGDRFLLSSDGLHNFVSHAQISRLLAWDTDAGRLAAGLVDMALANGTRDNVTALVVNVVSGRVANPG